MTDINTQETAQLTLNAKLAQDIAQIELDDQVQYSPRTSEKGSMKGKRSQKDGSGKSNGVAMDQFADLRKSMQRIERVIESGGISQQVQKNRQAHHESLTTSMNSPVKTSKLDKHYEDSASGKFHSQIKRSNESHKLNAANGFGSSPSSNGSSSVNGAKGSNYHKLDKDNKALSKNSRNTIAKPNADDPYRNAAVASTNSNGNGFKNKKLEDHSIQDDTSNYSMPAQIQPKKDLNLNGANLNSSTKLQHSFNTDKGIGYSSKTTLQSRDRKGSHRYVKKQTDLSLASGSSSTGSQSGDNNRGGKKQRTKSKLVPLSYSMQNKNRANMSTRRQVNINVQSDSEDQNNMQRSKSATSFKSKLKSTTFNGVKKPVSPIKSSTSAGGSTHTPKITYTKKSQRLDGSANRSALVTQSLNLNSMKDYQQTANEYALAKKALLEFSEKFDFQIFQDVKGNPESFSVFQRFCLMLLIIHGELERVQQDRSDEFLKKLNVYKEITNIKKSLDESKYKFKELQPLFQDSGTLKENKLQKFINLVVKYAELKAKLQDQSQVSLINDSQSAASEQIETQSNGSMMTVQTNGAYSQLGSKEYYQSSNNLTLNQKSPGRKLSHNSSQYNAKTSSQGSKSLKVSQTISSKRSDSTRGDFKSPENTTASKPKSQSINVSNASISNKKVDKHRHSIKQVKQLQTINVDKPLQMKQPLQNSSNANTSSTITVRKSVNLDSKKMDFNSRGSIGAKEGVLGTSLGLAGNSTQTIHSDSENRLNTHLIKIGQQELSDDASSAEEDKKKPGISEISSPTFIDLKMGKSSVISNENPFEAKPTVRGSPSRDYQIDLVQEAWKMVAHQLDNTHKANPLDFHFRVHKCSKGDSADEEKFFKYSGSPPPNVRYEKLDKELDYDYKFMRQQTQDLYDSNNALLANSIGYRSRAIGEQMINDREKEQSNGLAKKIDMSIIDRIKQMRSQSRESGDSLLQKRDEVIRQIQQKQGQQIEDISNVGQRVRFTDETTSNTEDKQ
ncbi:UNKNOWN [Stylonychia lemnae]|uniref:Uncharacterized protein n=1 Tax=Stylonychia lemnae TaxID=5949 RepID=A0A077ZZC6_STYLE|nr:UNKNOWN [Stylonychia lemnae]|eukprot:CDW75301.1 UNKNOWN [Stylonychia lemnae]